MKGTKFKPLPHCRCPPARCPEFLFGRGFARMMLLPVSRSRLDLQGEALDTAADVLCWVVLVVAPIVGIAVFLLLHILRRKSRRKNNTSDQGASSACAMLSLAFGGLLWPLAWWAYSKPVLYKMAYARTRCARARGRAAPSTGQRTRQRKLKQLRNALLNWRASSRQIGREGEEA